MTNDRRLQSAAKVWCACVGGIKNTGSVRSKADAVMTAEETHEATSLINGLKPSGLKSETTRLVRGVIKIVCLIRTAKPLDHETRPYALAVATLGEANATAAVAVLVLDVNDNAPVFSRATYYVVLPEGPWPRGPVGQVSATDRDSGKNARLSYILISDGKFFRINAETGKATTWQLLIYPPTQPTTDFLQASPTVVRRLWVREDDPPGTVIGSVSIASPGKEVVYSITDGDGDSRFGVNSQSGDIYIYQPLDYETAAQYSLTALAEDDAGEHTTMRVFVTVEDVNDHPPWFTDKMIRIALMEDAPIGSLAFAFCARDEDGTYPNSALRYSLASPLGFPFQIDPRSGRLMVAAPLDRETSPAYAFTITASDLAERRVERRHASVTARVFLMDVNDNQPTFKSADVVQVAENVAEGSLLHHFVASDADERENGMVSYIMLTGNQRGLFALEEKTGLLRLSAPLDFETARLHRLRVAAVDAGLPPLSSSQMLTVEVIDVNDSPPVFSRDVYVATVAENREPGQTVVQVSATDEDSGILKGVALRAIKTLQTLDREEHQNYTLTIQARDCGPAPLSSTTQLQLLILDQNDNAPAFTLDSYRTSISEGLPAGAAVLSVTAQDPDHGSNGVVMYSLRDDGGQGAFSINASTGAIRTTETLDRETRAQFSLKVLATDGGNEGPLSSVVSVTILVDDVNDNAPVLVPVTLIFSRLCTISFVFLKWFANLNQKNRMAAGMVSYSKPTKTGKIH
uniref:Cadherin domain-containing protein n=1 Tax=Hippocampus comes TaxID=109280 RepID=A0A3Q2YRP6_HIPCM